MQPALAARLEACTASRAIVAVAHVEDTAHYWGLVIKRRPTPLNRIQRKHAHRDPSHGGTIITKRPDALWGTERMAGAGCSGAIAHCVEDIVG